VASPQSAIRSPHLSVSESLRKHLALLPLIIIKMSKAAPQAPYRDSTDLPRPPPSYEPTSPPPGTSGDPLLGADRGRHSDDDIPDDFKYIHSL
jgi:hypothetical protein